MLIKHGREVQGVSEMFQNASPLRTEWFLLFLMYKSEYERGFLLGFLEGIRSFDSIKKKWHYMD